MLVSKEYLCTTYTLCVRVHHTILIVCPPCTSTHFAYHTKSTTLSVCPLYAIYTHCVCVFVCVTLSSPHLVCALTHFICVRVYPTKRTELSGPPYTHCPHITRPPLARYVLGIYIYIPVLL